MPQNTHHDSELKSQTGAYKARLNSWAVARLLPDTQRVIVARFRSRSDADGRLQHLHQMLPDSRFEVIFDCQRDETEN
ncbi:MAG: hypothetical protein PUP93_21055 [Rhizonema sp. NSF051]|nr:hypothetical protein [Rhizonema sp. NSF051]